MYDARETKKKVKTEMLQGRVESGKASRSESKFKGLREVSYMKIECLQIQGTRMDSQERILGRKR